MSVTLELDLVRSLSYLDSHHINSLIWLQAKRKRERMGDLKIVVAGCVASQEGSALLRRCPEIDLVMGRFSSLTLEITLTMQCKLFRHCICSLPHWS